MILYAAITDRCLQKIRSSLYSSFSLLGLTTTLFMGLLIILAEQAVAPLLRFLQRRKAHKIYSRLEWDTNALLELQRLAHEQLGFGAWEVKLGSTPVTTDGASCLAVLDISDPNHPVLYRSGSTDRHHVCLES